MSETSAPFFIVGCGRSGTTLLRLIFDAHPDVAIPAESHFIDRLAARWDGLLRDGRPDPARLGLFLKPHLLRMGIDRDEVRARIERAEQLDAVAVTELVFRTYADARGKARWGDKTPGYVGSMPLLARMWPEARFVHLIRDGRDVALSYLDQPFGPSSVADAALHWKRRVMLGRDHGRALGSRYAEVRYEDVVADPAREVARLCAFVGLDYDDRMLAYHERSSDVLPERKERWRGLYEPIRRDMRDWRTAMVPRDERRFEALAGPLLSALGYERRQGETTFAMRAWTVWHGASYATRAALARVAGRSRERATFERHDRKATRAREG